jgi:hypothetical protein
MGDKGGEGERNERNDGPPNSLMLLLDALVRG